MYKDTQLNINKCNKNKFLINFAIKKVFFNLEGEGSMADYFKLGAIGNPYERTGSRTGGAVGGFATRQPQQKGIEGIGFTGYTPNYDKVNCELTPVHKGGVLGNNLDIIC